jgi:hypothetical protein
MNRIAALVLFVLVALGSGFSRADSKSVLSDLGKALHDARSSHSEEKLRSSCSSKLSELVGLSKKTILDALGNPDLNEDVVSRDSDPFSVLQLRERRVEDNARLKLSVGWLDACAN